MTEPKKVPTTEPLTVRETEPLTVRETEPLTVRRTEPVLVPTKEPKKVPSSLNHLAVNKNHHNRQVLRNPFPLQNHHIRPSNRYHTNRHRSSMGPNVEGRHRCSKSLLTSPQSQLIQCRNCPYSHFRDQA